MDTNNRGYKLKTLLEADCESLKMLLEVLEHERKAITKGEPKDIAAITKQKLEQLESIEQLNHKRIELFRSAKQPVDSKNMESLIADAPSELHVELKQLWRSFQSQLKNCKKLNTLNETIANAKDQNIQEVLDLFSGKDTESDLYGPHGINISHNKSKGRNH